MSYSISLCFLEICKKLKVELTLIPVLCHWFFSWTIYNFSQYFSFINAYLYVNKDNILYSIIRKEIQHCNIHYISFSKIGYLSTTSKWFLNTSRDGDSTTSLGSLFQCLTTLSANNFFLISNLNLPWCILKPFPLVLSPVTSEKRPTLLLLQSPFSWFEESNKVSPQPPLSQTKQPQFL